MTKPTPCSADSGVTYDADGRPVAIPCEAPAKYLVNYRGIERPLCAGHKVTFCRSRPAATSRPAEQTP